MAISARAVAGQSFLFDLFWTEKQKFVQESKEDKIIPIWAAEESTEGAERTLPNYIKVYGTKKEQEKLTKILLQIAYTGEEAVDRRLIQEKLDQEGCKRGPLYRGNTVYPSQKLVKEFQKMKKTGSLKKMSKEMYKFLSLNFDIAHYDKSGYIAYYDESFSKLWEETLKRRVTRCPGWKTDVQEILKRAELV